MSHNHPSSIESSLVRSLQQQVQSLQKACEDKDEAYFELSATMASVQAEADYKVVQIQKQAAQQTKSTVAVTPAAPMTASNNASQGPGTTQSSQQSQTGAALSPLARHLLQQTSPSGGFPSSLLLLASSSGSEEQAASQLLWHLVEQCVGDAENCKKCNWLHEVLVFSAHARRELRRSMMDEAGKASSSTSSRIRGGTNISWGHAAQSLYEPLGNTTVSAASSLGVSGSDSHTGSRYTRELAIRLRNQLLKLDSPTKVDILSAVLSDSAKEERRFWQSLLCGTSDAPLIVLLLPLLVSDVTVSTRRTPASFTKDISPPGEIDIHTRQVVRALNLLRKCGGWACTKDMEDVSELFGNLLLDLLEKHFVRNRNVAAKDVSFTLAILQVVQFTLCHYPSRGVWWMRTQMALENGAWTCSGVGVAVQVFYKATVLRQESAISNECIRILHVVLKQIQEERQRADESSTSFVSFLSVVSEHEHLYRSACHDILQRERGRDIAKLVQLQVEEIVMDEEEEEDLKMQARDSDV